ncbi:[FeFe] hydrogenase H-cluster radical SAM maturase HydE [Treponema sp.]|uniref:[FeFe] hydrogenase H-cluster radical SAM maturase HydE n=1 Tax=Treponema sp. TaxID=166 RepID=UPI00298EBE22|nr:[FeFe] hydrogenase H-cluster radical SAM maturase HydE [Treponema sp.]MCQ2240827.1 [FeFe] hydrogenase H-cluster radical SAM maturase HydE [Treponema sp.]
MNVAEILFEIKNLSDEEFLNLLKTDEFDEQLFHFSNSRRNECYGNLVYTRGLIEFTNYCRNNCYYCGIRRGNEQALRYRMSISEILECCKNGYELGFRTFVLQGGEDPYFTDAIVCSLVSEIKKEFSDCAVTLSIGEKSRASYQSYFDAGADRYLLRHETACNLHYSKLHPKEMSLENRKRCLFDLKEIGYQVGAGFMVGSPFQTFENVLQDLRFLQELSPDMIGIGPFIPYSHTPFAEFKKGSLHLTLRLIAVLRLMFPYALIPATTALGTIHPQGRELGLKAGANVLMPNITSAEARKKYILYDNKICIQEDIFKCNECIRNRIESAGYTLAVDVGNVRR